MKYYLPINSTSLAHYFACACIKPARYFNNKPQDIQDRFSNSLLVSTELGTNDTDCCIELVLTKDEEISLIPCGNSFYLFRAPLPISRIRKIHFRNQRQLEQTLSIINMSTAFLPNSLATVTHFSNAVCDSAIIDNAQEANDSSQQIELYDRILGALALMKTAREPYMNYSENYASTLSFFNSAIRDNLESQNRQIVNKFFGLFTRTGSFAKSIKYLEKHISKEDLDGIAAEYNQVIKRSISKAIDFDKLSGMTYAFAVLQTYGVGGEPATKKIDGLVSTNFAGLKEGMAEGIALYYGYNRGYSVFSNSYGTSETGRQTVKFLLDSQLDYYTIESVYRFVFNANAVSSRFPYLDEWCPIKNQRPKRKTDYMVLDTVFVGKKKASVFSREYFLGFLAEIKAFDFLNQPLSSLIEHVWNKATSDTREELEESTEAKIAEAEAKWNAKYVEAKVEIDTLQKQNDTLIQELARLKSNGRFQYSNNGEMAQLLQDSGSVCGQECATQEINDLPEETQPLSIAAVDGYSTGKKAGKTTKAKSSGSKTKGPTKSSKKAIEQRSSDNEVGLSDESHSSSVDTTIEPSQIMEEGTLPFGQNE